MIEFSHPNPTVGTLRLRLAPTKIDWSYNLKTKTFDTYAGQVVQILGINFENLILEGQFGKEGPHGKISQNGKLVPRPVTTRSNYRNAGKYATGLTQMYEYFRNYFSVASAGGDQDTRGNYDQQPMKITYSGALDIPVDSNRFETWLVYPKEFPSYRRSQEDFAPEWRVVCDVYEPATEVKLSVERGEIQRLSDAVGWKPLNKFSDPLGTRLLGNIDGLSPEEREKVLAQATEAVASSLDDYLITLRDQIPAYTPEALEQLLLQGGSFPLVESSRAQPRSGR